MSSHSSVPQEEKHSNEFTCTKSSYPFRVLWLGCVYRHKNSPLHPLYLPHLFPDDSSHDSLVKYLAGFQATKWIKEVFLKCHTIHYSSRVTAADVAIGIDALECSPLKKQQPSQPQHSSLSHCRHALVSAGVPFQTHCGYLKQRILGVPFER